MFVKLARGEEKNGGRIGWVKLVLTHPILKQVLNSTVVKIILISYSSDGLLSKKEIGNIRVRGYKMVSTSFASKKIQIWYWTSTPTRGV